MKTRNILSLLTALALALFAPAAVAEGLTLTDMAGREIALEAPATRVIALNPADCEILYALGAEDVLVGRGEYCNYPGDVTELPSVNSGAETNIEQILALEPQVIVMSKMAQTVEQVEALEAAQSEPLTVGDLLAAGPRENGTGWYWAPPCTQVLDKAEKLALFLGDDCFTVSTSGSTTTYTLKVDTLSLADKLSGLTVEDETGELTLLLDYLKGDLKVDCSGTIKVRDNKLVDMDVDFTVKLPASVTAGMPVDITVAVSGDSTGAECTLTAKAAYGGKLELKAEASVEKTSGTPAATPPEGAVIHTQDEYLDYGEEYLTDAAWGRMSASR